MQEILKMGIGENILHQKQFIVIAEDGVIYRIPCERLDSLTDEALNSLKEQKEPGWLEALWLRV